jgi:hypothetical protein
MFVWARIEEKTRKKDLDKSGTNEAAAKQRRVAITCREIKSLEINESNTLAS